MSPKHMNSALAVVFLAVFVSFAGSCAKRVPLRTISMMTCDPTDNPSAACDTTVSRKVGAEHAFVPEMQYLSVSLKGFFVPQSFALLDFLRSDSDYVVLVELNQEGCQDPFLRRVVKVEKGATVLLKNLDLLLDSRYELGSLRLVLKLIEVPDGIGDDIRDIFNVGKTALNSLTGGFGENELLTGVLDRVANAVLDKLDDPVTLASADFTWAAFGDSLDDAPRDFLLARDYQMVGVYPRNGGKLVEGMAEIAANRLKVSVEDASRLLTDPELLRQHLLVTQSEPYVYLKVGAEKVPASDFFGYVVLSMTPSTRGTRASRIMSDLLRDVQVLLATPLGLGGKETQRKLVSLASTWEETLGELHERRVLPTTRVTDADAPGIPKEWPRSHGCRKPNGHEGSRLYMTGEEKVLYSLMSKYLRALASQLRSPKTIGDVNAAISALSAEFLQRYRDWGNRTPGIRKANYTGVECTIFRDSGYTMLHHFLLSNGCAPLSDHRDLKVPAALQGVCQRNVSDPDLKTITRLASILHDNFEKCVRMGAALREVPVGYRVP